MLKAATVRGLRGQERRLRTAAALALLAAGLALAGAPASARAAEIHTVTFLPEEAAEELFELPSGIQGLAATAIGGTGAPGSGCSGSSGGRGGYGEQLAAGLPGPPPIVRVRFIAGGAGGASLGEENSYGCTGGEGGGASELEVGGSLLLAAAGGGGGGAAEGNFGAQGGAGGDAEESTGGSGEAGSGPGGGFERHYTAGGEGATLLGPGLLPGAPGLGAQGGSAAGAASAGGGGGGSGYFGGASGETIPFTGSEGQPEFGGAGGGGAGSSYIAPALATVAGSFASGAGSEQEVVLRYEGGPKIAAPEALILSPANHAYVLYRSPGATSFECREGNHGPGISLCEDSSEKRAAHDASAPTAGLLHTGSLGEFTYAVTARSKSGRSAQATIRYTVAEAPTATITLPSGGYYALDQTVSTSFECAESATGTTLASCDSSTGSSTAAGGIATLDTSTPGAHTFTVTAASADDLSSAAVITYYVAPARELALFTAAGCSEWTVPAGVVWISAEAVGESGATAPRFQNARVAKGGSAGVASGTIEVAPGEQLQACVAQFSGAGGKSQYGGDGGRGGGLSGLAPLPGDFTAPLLVAAGGGGGGGSTFGHSGGNGGAAGEAGAEGSRAAPYPGASGGQVGAAGSASGGEGGYGSEFSGGGGGGGAGFPGGGGGEGGVVIPYAAFSGGGGAGGTSFCAAACTFSAAAAERVPLVAISYEPPRLCSTVSGSGRGALGGTAAVSVTDSLSTQAHRSETLGIQLPGFPGYYIKLSKLQSAVCGGSEQEAVFRGSGQAYFDGHPGYALSFAFRQAGGRDYLTLRVTKGAQSYYTLIAAPMTRPSSERFK